MRAFENKVLRTISGPRKGYVTAQINFLKEPWKEGINDKVLMYASETCTLTKRDRKQLNVSERKVYRRILGPVYDNEKENWRILTNKEIYASVKNLL